MKFLRDIKIKPLDIVIILLLFFSSFSVFAFMPKAETGASAEVRVNGQVVKQFDLNKNETWTYRAKNGNWNIIEVKDGKIRDKADNSPDQIAVHTGWIDQVGQTAVCLPHNLVIQVMSGKENNEVDYNA